MGGACPNPTQSAAIPNRHPHPLGCLRETAWSSLSLGISAAPDPPSQSPVSALLSYPAAAPRLSGILCVLVGVRPRVPRSGAAAAAALAGV